MVGIARAPGHASATAAAITVLGEGGNIIDAAIAASFTISVERPHSAGLGGGGKPAALLSHGASYVLAFVPALLHRDGRPEQPLARSVWIRWSC